MRYSGTWLTPADETILEHLREYGPTTLESLVDRRGIVYSEAYIEERCTTLVGRGRLVTFADGRYRLTERGAAYLNGELDPTELERE